MKLTKLFAITLLTVFSLVAAAKSNGTETEVKATINGLQKALNTSDITELQNIYSDEATLVPTDKPVLDNPASIATFWNNQLSEGKSVYNIDVIDLQIDDNDNIAYISALWSATVTIGGAYTEIRDGYLSNVLVRNTEGNWKIQAQNWN